MEHPWRVSPHRPARPAATLLVLALLSACTPTIDSLTPTSGPERTLVQIQGQTIFAGILWDAETPSETGRPGGFLGATMFSVPAGASLAPHDVQLLNGTRRSNKVPFTVTAAEPFGAPRLDRVSMAGATFQANGKLLTWLIVQGGNIDVGAEVLVDGVVQPTVALKALRSELYGVTPSTLGNPLYHYLALLSAPGERDPGATLAVRVRNADGVESATLNYTLPANQASVDSDGDDLPDDIEKNGFDANGDGTIDVDLPALGANPLVPDVFLEVDVMQGLTNTPAAAVFTALHDAFRAAPIINLADSNGINLHVDNSGTVPFFTLVDQSLADDATTDLANFYTLKTANFDNANRGRIYHYCIWGNMMPGGFSGVSDVNFTSGNGGDDCLVTFDDFGAGFQTVRSQVATLMHELGHDLGQRHGGETHFQRNPAYNSVMSYSWQLRTGLTSATRVARPVCVPFYYADATAAEAAGALPAVINNVLDYSEGMGRDLVEATLNESAGVCDGVGVNWDGDATPNEASVAFDVNGDGDTGDTWRDFPNWARIVFVGPRTNGSTGT